MKRGDFSEPEKRQLRPVPDGVGGDSSARSIVEIEAPPVSQTPPQQTDETDYDAIRRKIAEYKKKITELEKLLPNNR